MTDQLLAIPWRPFLDFHLKYKITDSGYILVITDFISVWTEEVNDEAALRAKLEVHCPVSFKSKTE